VHFKTYYYLVESYRENGKVHQRTLAYLGEYPTVEEALAGLPKEIEEWRKLLLTAYQQRDEALAYRKAALHEGPEPEFVKDYSAKTSIYQQELQHERRLQLSTSRIRYKQAEGHLSWVEKRVAALEDRLAKLQALSNSDGSAHENCTLAQ
jgi:uncharacterized tellurite resistance protein B-like protein